MKNDLPSREVRGQFRNADLSISKNHQRKKVRIFRFVIFRENLKRLEDILNVLFLISEDDTESMLPTDIADTVELSRRLLEILQKAGPECEEELKKLREELCAARKLPSKSRFLDTLVGTHLME